MSPSLVAVALLLASPALGPATWRTASLYDWSRDGSSVVWSVTICDELRGPKYLMATDDAGRPTQLFHDGLFDLGDAPEPDVELPRAMELRKRPWIEGTARAEEEFVGWESAHPLRGDPVKPQRTSREKEHGAGKDRVQFRTQSVGEGCPPLTLQLALDHGFIDVFQDRCLPGEPRHRNADGAVTMAWSPDGKRLAVAWEVHRSTSSEEVAEGVPEGLVTRGYVAVVPRAALEGKEPFRTVKRVLCPVDVLDARSGKGPGLEALAGKLTSAGFTIGHTGKAGTQRTATEVYYAPGFAPEAREAAALAGVKPDEVEDAVKPLTWKSAYPVTIAVGAPR